MGVRLSLQRSFALGLETLQHARLGVNHVYDYALLLGEGFQQGLHQECLAIGIQVDRVPSSGGPEHENGAGKHEENSRKDEKAFQDNSQI